MANEVSIVVTGEDQSAADTMRKVSGAADGVTGSLRDVESQARPAGQALGAASVSADDLGDSLNKTDDSARKTGDGLDRAGEAADDLDTRAMGFRDTLTGVQDTMKGTAEIARGNLFEGFFTLGMGVGDLGSGMFNLLVPALGAVRTGLARARTAVLGFITTTRGATLALGGVGIALAAIAAAFAIFRSQAEEVEVSVDDLVTDLERFADTGRVTGEIIKILGDDAADLKGRLQALDPTLRENRGLWESTLDTFRATHTEQRKLKEELSDLDEGLAAFIEAGGDGEQALQRLALHYGLNQRELNHVVEALPRYRQELQRAEERQRDAERATLAHTESLKEFADQLRAQTDPVFGFVSAQRQLETAQQRVTEAEDEFGRKSPQYEQALLDLAQAELGVTSAAAKVEEGVRGDLLPTLRQMRDDGVLSEDAFRALRAAIESAGDEARRQDGTRARIVEEHVIITTRITRNIIEQHGVNAPTPFAAGGIVGGNAQDGGDRKSVV